MASKRKKGCYVPLNSNAGRSDLERLRRKLIVTMRKHELQSYRHGGVGGMGKSTTLDNAAQSMGYPVFNA